MLLALEVLFAKSAPGGCVAFKDVPRIFAVFMSWITLNVFVGQDDMKTFEDVQRAAQSFTDLKLTVLRDSANGDEEQQKQQPAAGDDPAAAAAVKKRKTRDMGDKPLREEERNWKEMMGDAFEVDCWEDSWEEEGSLKTDWRSPKLWPDLKESYVMYDLIMTTDRKLAVNVTRTENELERVVCYQ